MIGLMHILSSVRPGHQILKKARQSRFIEIILYKQYISLKRLDLTGAGEKCRHDQDNLVWR